MLQTRVRTESTKKVVVLERMRTQIALGLIIGCIFPAIIVLLFTYNSKYGVAEGTKNSTIASLVAITLAVILYRRVTSFPGIRAFRFVFPTYASAFAAVLTIILAIRVDYSRPMLALSFTFSLAIAIGSALLVLRKGVRRFYVVPFGRYDPGFESTNTEWVVMTKPEIPADPAAIIVADLRFDHEQSWEQMLAHAAVAGYPVYHVKHIRESLTGRVSMEHISENSFGSLLPNLAYRKVKRALELVISIIVLPILIMPMIIVAVLIKIDSRGPVLFRQQRMGYRVEAFRIFKFRTMRIVTGSEYRSDERGAAMTGDNDPRITRLGRFLRRSRIDELPQILNIIRGEMSWIGPRPEAVQLSEWYEKEIPFYFYRHIVRPGITGWAQVNQGHVSDIQAVSTKLGYDFYYIQNFSAWLDVLIALRTVSTMLSGFGAR